MINAVPSKVINILLACSMKSFACSVVPPQKLLGLRWFELLPQGGPTEQPEAQGLSKLLPGLLGSWVHPPSSAQVCSGNCGMNEESKDDALRNLSSFISKSSARVRARFRSPRSISDVALCSAVTTAFMVCHSFVFEGLECSLNANVWHCSSPGQRYLPVKLLHCCRAAIPCSRTTGSISPVVDRVRVCSGISGRNDDCKILQT